MDICYFNINRFLNFRTGIRGDSFNTLFANLGKERRRMEFVALSEGGEDEMAIPHFLDSRKFFLHILLHDSLQGRSGNLKGSQRVIKIS